jgi:hypothetical protein
MAVRAAMSVQCDGLVFDNESTDTLEQDFDRLPQATQQHWLDLAELLYLVLTPSRQFATTNSTPQGDTQNG